MRAICASMEKEVGTTFKICPGAKCSSISSHDAHAQPWLLIQPIPDAVKLMMSRIIDAVELLRPIESHEKDVRRGEGECSKGCRWCWRLEYVLLRH